MINATEQAAIESLRDFQRNGTAGIHRELALYLQEKIDSGVLAPGAKLPSLRDLARLWDTNVFSVKLATDALVDMGLMTKRQGKGMFVADQNGKVLRVGIYMSKAPDSFALSDLSFAFALRDLLCARLRQQGIEFVLYDDYRPTKEHLKPPADLQDAIISGRLQIVIGIIVRASDRNWFNRLPIRKIQMMRDPLIDFEGIVEKLKNRGCQRVALIAPEGVRKKNGEIESFLTTGLKSVGLTIRPDRLRIIEEHDVSRHGWGRLGYETTLDLLNAKRRPDALIVYPDNAVQGAIQAIMKVGIKVPDDLFVLFHRNLELGYYCNFPADYIDVSISDIADKLIRRIADGSEEPSSTGFRHTRAAEFH